MSEQDQRAALGQLLQDYAAAKKELKQRSDDLNRISARFGGLHQALTANSEGMPQDINTVMMILSEFPDDMTPAVLRELVNRHSEVKGKVEACKAQLRPYGVE